MSESSLPPSGKPSTPRSKSPAQPNGKNGKASPATRASSILYARTPIGKPRKSPRAAHKGRGAISARQRPEKTHRHLSASLHEARTHGPHHGPRRREARRNSFIHTHNQNPQALRGEIAQMLGTSPDHVIVHTIRDPATTADPTAATPARKTKP